jgi:hypothetical protein
MAGSALSGIMGAFGALQSASSQAAAARYNAAVARNNQQIQAQNAAQAVQTGRAAAQVRDLQTARELGALTAAEGASGIDVGSTTSREVRQSAEQTGRLDTLNVMQRAMNEARGYNVAAMSEAAKATLDTFQANQAQTAGLFSAAGSLLGGATSFADSGPGFRSNPAVRSFRHRQAKRCPSSRPPTSPSACPRSSAPSRASCRPAPRTSPRRRCRLAAASARPRRNSAAISARPPRRCGGRPNISRRSAPTI